MASAAKATSAPNSHTDKDSSTITDIDPDGDLTLVVGSDSKKTSFLVCSKSLSRSSPFWKTLLYGPFAERTEGRRWTVELPGDDPNAMEIILRLVHGSCHKIPKVNINLAFEVTVLTNKYEMTHCLWPCAKQWLSDVPVSWGNYYDQDWDAPPIKWLAVTQELGDHVNYLRALEALVLRTRHVSHGQRALGPNQGPGNFRFLTLVCSNEEVSADGEAMLAGILADLEPIRLKVLAMIESDIQKGIKTLEDVVKINWARKDNDKWSPCLCRLGETAPLSERRLCDLAMMGGVYHFSRTPEWPLQEPQKTQKSLKCLSKELFLKCQAIAFEVNRNQGTGHQNCTPFQTKTMSLEAMFHQVVEDTLQDKIAYIKRQAVLSGLQSEEDDGGKRTLVRKRPHNKIAHNDSDDIVPIARRTRLGRFRQKE